MRVFTGNPHNEAHGGDLRVIDWIAPPGTDLVSALEAMEQADHSLKLYNRGDGEVNGYVNASLRPDGSLYICVHLYQHDCTDDKCPAGHGVVKIHPPPAPAGSAEGPGTRKPREQAIVEAVGEHPRHKLTGDPKNDEAVLKRLGFKDEDVPLRAMRDKK